MCDNENIFYLYLRNKNKSFDIFDNYDRIKKEHYENLQTEIFSINDSIKIFHETVNSMNKEHVDDAAKYLFYWFILTNRLDHAKLFWKLGEVKKKLDQICLI